ncbi:retrovirus-related Pol polyprotein from transposon 17.6 [Trichonephila clavipes]|uniref:RNA-directed DNA polymerase n=1 Tax=Trichonephila clavipes TaxID=2585209 RepID=A0A8X6WCR6_TRICX|nr:retrovirus-related Pol polyprotein from transposon 17.6 [Trichonephila clavipes]
MVDKAKEAPRKSFGGHSQFETRTPMFCYGCGKPGYIKNAVFRININGVPGTAFADSEASHSIAGETLYSILLQQGTAFEKAAIFLSFADGIVTQKVLRTVQTVLLEGRKFKTPFIILPDAKNNSTLLGVDFLGNAGILLNFRKNCWTFYNDSRKSYNFVTPYQMPPYQLNPARKELLKKELSSLLQQGIIVECESPYVSPIVLIPKPNGSLHLCIDYQKLNALTVLDSYPLPRMDDLLNETKPTPYMSIIDLLSGYHLVKVVAEDQDKTAFTCPFEHYITKEGISVDPQKTTAIADIWSQTSLKQVQSFVQTCSWYRRYIPNFSQIAKPLTDLTKKNAMWKWVSELEEAFRELKSKLGTPHVLKPADGTKPFVIRTDASCVALGAVLLLGERCEEHPIEYARQLLSSSERNYSTTERVAFVVVWTFEKFKGYVEGQTIRLSSDHQPLKWLLSLKSPTGRLARWALQIQSYYLTIDYISGKSNFIANLLSRPTLEQEKADSNILAVSVDFPTRSPNCSSRTIAG